LLAGIALEQGHIQSLSDSVERYVHPELDVVIASNSTYADYPNDARGDSRRLAMMRAIAEHVAQ
jgi:uncharacterized protein (DUF4213/DUF364 family)